MRETRGQLKETGSQKGFLKYQPRIPLPGNIASGHLAGHLNVWPAGHHDHTDT